MGRGRQSEARRAHREGNGERVVGAQSALHRRQHGQASRAGVGGAVSGMNLSYDDSVEVVNAIRDGLIEHNRKVAGLGDPVPINVAVRADSGQERGGVVARFNLDTHYVDLDWIDEAWRGSGHGRAMFELVEKKARTLGAG